MPSNSQKHFITSEVRLKIGRYTIFEDDQSGLWLKNDDGEGMALNLDKFERHVHDFFVQEF